MKRRIAVYGGSFDPPGLHHRKIAEELRRHFDQVLIVPCGPRPDKPTDIDPVFRAALTDLAFRAMDGVEVDLFDLEQATFTRTHELQEKYATNGDEIWHVVGTDLITGGRDGNSFIHTTWQNGGQLWKDLKFAVVTRRGHECGPADLPPNHKLIQLDHVGSSFTLREMVFKSMAVDHLTGSHVGEYIRRHKLYHGGSPTRAIRHVIKEPRLKLFYDERNAKASEWAQQFKQYEVADDPNLILVIGGDGTMLRAIQQHWRLRVPFYGVNAGHLGFLLNKASEVLDGKFPPPEVVVRQMPLLYVEFKLKDGSTLSGLTFNDAWVERSTGQTAWLELKIDGRMRIEKLVCDGALISTAAGSTAYAMSMGATPLLADTPAWLLVGSNVMQPMKWKSALLSPEATIELKNVDPNKRPLNGFIWGNLIGEVLEMKARVSRIAGAEVAFHPGHDITEKIAQIQFPEATNFPGL